MGFRHKYEQLVDHIRAGIDSGEIRPGLIPREVDLAAKHGFSKVTVSKALGVLVDEGLIYRVKSKGTYVNGADAVMSVGLSCTPGIGGSGFERRREGRPL